MAILDDFELHKDDVLNRLRVYHASAYFAILSRLLDSELQIEAPALDDYDEAELAQTVALSRSALALDQNPRTALLELQGVLVNQASLDPTRPVRRINGDCASLPLDSSLSVSTRVRGGCRAIWRGASEEHNDIDDDRSADGTPYRAETDRALAVTRDLHARMVAA